MASRSIDAWPISCAIRTRTSGSGGTSPGRSRRSPRRRRSTMLVAGLAGPGRVPPIQDRIGARAAPARARRSSRSRASRSRRSRSRRAAATSLTSRSTSNLFGKKTLGSDTLLADALEQKMARTKDRIYRLLSLIYPVEGHRRCGVDAAARRRPQPRERLGVSRQHPHRATCASRSCRCWKTCRSRRRCGAATC